MRSAALYLGLGILLSFGALGSSAADGASRSTPSRPAATGVKLAALRTKKFGKFEYVRVTDAAKQLGLKHATHDRGRRVVLKGTNVSAELESDTRDITVNGMRVFLGEKTEDAGGELYVSRIDYERCLMPLLRPGHGVGGPIPGTKTIVLDPGHGGRDNGTSQHEKVYALDVARRTEKILEKAGYRVVLTRTDDRYLTLAERPAIAHANKADLFVSIHFNALERDRKTSGVEVYTFPPQFQRGTNAWSPGERNDAESDDAPVNRFDYWNNALAHAIHRRFVGDLKAFDRGKKLMHLGVLRSLNCPGVLVECGFLTSTVEAKKIATPAYREKLAETLARGIRDYAAVVESSRQRNVASAARR